MKWKTEPKGWVVKGERPEEIYGNPKDYYSDEEVERYSRSGGMRKAQETIANRIIELLSPAEKSKILDLGCGPGYTSQVYKDAGCNVVGLDVLPNMLEKAKEKGLKVVRGDMRNLKELFKKGEFDSVVSASALQWVKEREDITRIAEGIHYILKNNGKAVIQFYPRSEIEMKNVLNIFIKSGFSGRLIIDNPSLPIKRVIYLVIEKTA